MSTLDGLDLFSSGPNDVVAGSWARSLQRRSFAGVNGELILDLGLRCRNIVQSGRLQASSAAMLHTLISQIEQKLDGQTHTLVDNHEQSYSRVLVEHFELRGPIRRGRGFWCDYTLRYIQLP